MKHTKKVIILGTGGTSRDIVDIVDELGFECMGFLDDDQSKLGSVVKGYKIIGSLKEAHNYQDVHFINGIGNPSNFMQKEKIISSSGLLEKDFITLIHPSASISKNASIGLGTVIFQNVVVASNARIGNHVVILPNSVINHDDWIEDYSIIASGVCISGYVKIGKSCYLGAGSLIKEGLKVGDNSLIGMGSVVLDDIPAGNVVVGNPAKFLRIIQGSS